MLLKTKGSWVDWLVFKNTRLPVGTVSHSSEARKTSLEGFELEFCWEFIVMVPFIEKNKCLSPFLGPHSTNFFCFLIKKNESKTSQKTSLNYESGNLWHQTTPLFWKSSHFYLCSQTPILWHPHPPKTQKTSLNYTKNEPELIISYKSYRVWAQKVYMNNLFGVGRRR